MAPNNRLSPSDRYERDAMFRGLVDTMTSMIAQADYTPTEVREAAVLAATRYETIHARPKYLLDETGLRRVDGHHGREPG